METRRTSLTGDICTLKGLLIHQRTHAVCGHSGHQARRPCAQIAHAEAAPRVREVQWKADSPAQFNTGGSGVLSMVGLLNFIEKHLLKQFALAFTSLYTQPSCSRTGDTLPLDFSVFTNDQYRFGLSLKSRISPVKYWR